MKRKAHPAVDPQALLATVGAGRTLRHYRKNQTIFSQGDRADAVFLVERGKVKLTVLSRQGKQAVIPLLGPGDFFGEGCLAGQPLRMSTATAMTDSSITVLPTPAMLRALREDTEFSERFTTYLLSRNIRIEEDLVDHLFNSSEKRLARILLLLANGSSASSRTTAGWRSTARCSTSCCTTDRPLAFAPPPLLFPPVAVSNFDQTSGVCAP